MSVTFEEACRIVAPFISGEAKVKPYGFDLGDAWLPAVEWDNPLEIRVGGSVLLVRKSDGIVYEESAGPESRIVDGTPVGDWPPE